MESVHAVQARHTVRAGLFLIGEDANAGVSRGLCFDFSHQCRISIYTVIMSIRANHRAVKTHIASLESGNNLNLCARKVTFGNTVLLIEEPQNTKLDAVGGFLIFDGKRSEENIQVFARNALGERFLVLLSAQMRQKVGDGENGVIILLANADVDAAAVLTIYNTMDRQRNGGPLVLTDTAVIVCAEVGQPLLFKKGYRTQIKARCIHMGNVQMEALRQALCTDGSGKNALFAVDVVDLIAGMELHAHSKGAIARLYKKFLAVLYHFALGLAAVQEFFVALTESICFGNCRRRFVCYGLILVEQLLQFFC